MSQICKTHSKVLDLYCPSHDAPVCSLCISESHRECKDIVSLDEVAKNVVSSSSFCNLEQNVGNLLKNLSQLKEERERNSKQLQSDKKTKNISVREMRRRLDERLNTLEEKLLQELSSKSGTCETEINNSLSEIESKTKASCAVQSNIAHLKEMATDVQLFLAIRVIDKSVSIETTWFHEIANQNQMDELTLDLNTEPLEDILETKSLGSIRIERSRNTVPIIHPSMKEAQIPLEVMRSGIDQIRLQRNINFQYNTKKIDKFLFGCLICSNGDIILVDGPSEKLAVFNQKGNYIKDILVPGKPSDLTEISVGRIAITYGNGDNFEIADIKDYHYKTVKLVKTTSTCWGTSCDNGQLAMKLTFEGIHLYNTDGLKIRQMKDEESYPNLIYNIAISHKHICYSFSNQNFVSCVGLDGTIIWRYQSDSLKDPKGITTDEYGNVYVVGQDSKK